jgi:hypothetical protein
MSEVYSISLPTPSHLEIDSGPGFIRIPWQDVVENPRSRLGTMEILIDKWLIKLNIHDKRESGLLR